MKAKIFALLLSVLLACPAVLAQYFPPSGGGGGGGGSGTVTEIDTGEGVNGGPITDAGTLTIADPSASTLGGIRSFALQSHKFLVSISTSGIPAAAQPAFTDISSGSITASQMLALTDTYLYVGNGSNVPAAVALSGDATLSDTGVISLKTLGTGAGSCTSCNITFDANGRETAYTDGSSSGTVNSGTSGYVGYYAGSGTAISGEAHITSAQMPVLTDTYLYVGNGSNQPAAVALSGDATLADTGAMTLATVNTDTSPVGSSTSIPTVTANAKGLITAVTGNVVIAPAGTLSGTTLNSTVITSSLTTVGTIGTGTWQGTAIGLGYIAGIAQNRVLGSVTSGTNAPAALTATQLTTIPNLANTTLQGMMPAVTDGQIAVGQTSSNATGVTVSGDATLADTGALTVTSTNGSAFVASATTNALNASNISSGTLSSNRLPSSVVYNNGANIYSTGSQNFSSATALILPLTSDPSSTAGAAWVNAGLFKFWDNAGTPVKHTVVVLDTNQTFSGTILATTQSPLDNSTKLATTAYCDAAVTAGGGGGGSGTVNSGTGGLLAYYATTGTAVSGLTAGTQYQLAAQGSSATEWDYGYDGVTINSTTGTTTVTLTNASASLQENLAASGTRTYTLPAANTCKGKIFTFNSNATTQTSIFNFQNSDTFHGNTISSITVTGAESVVSDGISNWTVLSAIPNAGSGLSGVSANNGEYKLSITAPVTVALGGSGQTSSLTPGGVIYSYATTQMACTAAGTAGQVFVSNSGGTPFFSSGLNYNSGTLTIGVSTSVAGSVTLYGATSGSLNISTPAVSGTGTTMILGGPVTTVSGTGGSYYWSQPQRGSCYKKVIVVFNGYTNTSTSTISYSTNFTNTPDVFAGSGATSAGLVCTTTTSALTIPIQATSTTGVVIIEGI